MKKSARYGFVGTSGLLIMIASGVFFTLYGTYLVWKMMNGLEMSQSPPFFGTLFIAGILPYIAGWMMFRFGKKIVSKP